MDLSARLQQKSIDVLTRVERHEAYRLLFDAESRLERTELPVLLRNILLQTFYYGGHITEAVFTAIGRFPKAKPQLMRPLAGQVMDEVYHPEMAGKDFVRLGGDPTRVDPARISPAAFVIAAVCRTIAERADPFCYLGFLALLESSTPVLTERLMPVLDQLGLRDASKFVPVHAREDHMHAELVWKHIDRVVSLFPGSERTIEFGFDCLALVYPLLVWDEAVVQTRAEIRRALPGQGVSMSV
jgi:heme oxygenase-like protein